MKILLLAVTLVLVACASDAASPNLTLPVTDLTTGVPTTSAPAATTTTISTTTSTPTTSTTASTQPTTTTEPVDLGTTIIDPASVEYVTMTPTVLYRASIGTGVDQLFVDPCQECDPPRPWGPMVTSDGTIVIVDSSRLVIVQEGVPSAVPLPEGLTMIGQPLVTQGRLYLPTATGTPDVGELQALSVDDLRSGTYRVLDTYPIAGQPDVRVRIEGNELQVNAAAVVVLDGVAARPEIEFALNHTPPTMTVTYSGQHRIWQFPPSWNADGWALTDGSVVSAAQSQDLGDFYVQLLADGTAVAGISAGPNAAMDMGVQIDDDGIVQLERVGDVLEVVHYPLPGA